MSDQEQFQPPPNTVRWRIYDRKTDDLLDDNAKGQTAYYAWLLSDNASKLPFSEVRCVQVI